MSRSFGAVTILNATATGHGASLAVRDGIEAEWVWGGDTVHLDADADDRLAVAVHGLLCKRLGRSDGARIRTRSAFPPARGLKTSSGAAAAMLRAGMEAAGDTITDDELIRLAVEASRQASVTLTGAFDDQTAVVRGGCHLTDNAASTVLESLAVEPWTVAIWIPEVAIAKSDVAGIATDPVAPLIEAAEVLLRMGDLPGAMTANGAAFLRLYQAAGLPVTDAPVDAAVAAGALGAGLSGTGPAVAALFEPGSSPDIEEVPGGSWIITEAVP